MSDESKVYDFDWLPGFRDMMSCDKKEAPEKMLPPEHLHREEQDYWKDYDFLIRSLPTIAREIWVVAEAILDQYEYEGSPIYVEFPDQETILRIARMVYDKLKYHEQNMVETTIDGMEQRNYYYVPEGERNEATPLWTIILVILYWNMHYRRNRYYRRRRVFQN